MKTPGGLTIGLVLIGLVPLSMGGCKGIVDDEAKRYDAEAAIELGGFFEARSLASVVHAESQIPITGSWGRNQARMLQESAASFTTYLEEHPIETDYALLGEYLIGGRGTPVGIHAYLMEADGTAAYVVLLNSHHSAFGSATLEEASDCTAVLIRVLGEDLAEGR